VFTAQSGRPTRPGNGWRVLVGVALIGGYMVSSVFAYMSTSSFLFQQQYASHHKCTASFPRQCRRLRYQHPDLGLGRPARSPEGRARVVATVVPLGVVMGGAMSSATLALWLMVARPKRERESIRSHRGSSALYLRTRRSLRAEPSRAEPSRAEPSQSPTSGSWGAIWVMKRVLSIDMGGASCTSRRRSRTARPSGSPLTPPKAHRFALSTARANFSGRKRACFV
jgi:hypothetical protein